MTIMPGNFKPLGAPKGGLKRPFDAMADPASKKPRRENVKKEAAKEANAQLRTKLEEEYTQVACEIAPMIASIIDSYGGATTLGLVSQHQELLAEMERIPAGYSKKIKKITELYPEYIVSLPDGVVATAMGYENGTVSSEGVVDKEAMQLNHKQKKDNDKALGVASPPLSASQPKVQPGMASGKSMERLQRACDQIARVGKLSNPKVFNNALQELQAAREIAFKAGAQPNQPPHTPSQKEVNAFIHYVRGFMIAKGLEAGTPMRICELACDPESKKLHANIGGGKRFKMSKLLEDAVEFFVVSRDGEHTDLTVALTEKGAQGNAQKPRRPFTKGKGKGKGKGPRA